MSEHGIEGPLGERPPVERQSEESVKPGGPGFEGEHGERAGAERAAGVEDAPGDVRPM